MARKSSTRWLASLVTAATLLVLTQPASATGTIDQSYVSSSGGVTFVGCASNAKAQTFTAGVSGVLDQVDVRLKAPTGVPAFDGGPWGDLAVTINTTSGGVPGGPVVGSAPGTIPASAASATFDWESTTGLSASVVAGTQYAIVVTGPTDLGVGCWAWEADAGTNYAGGTAFSSVDNGTTWTPFGITADLGFKTYVTASGAYTISPFSQPVDNLPTQNVAKAGSIIPVKFSVFDASGAPVTNLTLADVVVTSSQGGDGCGTGAGTDAIETYVGSSGLQNLGGGAYQYNWKTQTSYKGQCRTLTVALSQVAGSEDAGFLFK